MRPLPPRLGYRFHPSPTKGLAYLLEFISGRYRGPIREDDVYGDKEPWEVYGNSTGILHIFAPKSSVDPSQNNLWLLEEYCVSQVPPELEYRKEYALCLLKKKKTIKNEQPTATAEESDSDLNQFLENPLRAYPPEESDSDSNFHLFLENALLSADADADSSVVQAGGVPSSDASLDSFFEGALLEIEALQKTATAMPNPELESVITFDYDELIPVDAIFDELEMSNHNHNHNDWDAQELAALIKSDDIVLPLDEIFDFCVYLLGP